MPHKCAGCDYVFQPLPTAYYCQYILKTGRCRPCKFADPCTVRRTQGIPRASISISKPPEKRERKRTIKKWHTEAGRLYKAGKNDGEIARELGVSVEAVHTWRHRAGLAANSGTGRPRKGTGK